MSQDEVDRYVSLGNEGIAFQQSFDGGVYAVMAGMLQSPHFLYLNELGAETEEGGRLQLTGLELASRMAFFLLASPPDEALTATPRRWCRSDSSSLRQGSSVSPLTARTIVLLCGCEQRHRYPQRDPERGA